MLRDNDVEKINKKTCPCSQRVCHRVMTISINCESAGDLSR